MFWVYKQIIDSWRHLDSIYFVKTEHCVGRRTSEENNPQIRLRFYRESFRHHDEPFTEDWEEVIDRISLRFLDDEKHPDNRDAVIKIFTMIEDELKISIEELTEGYFSLAELET